MNEKAKGPVEFAKTSPRNDVPEKTCNHPSSLIQTELATSGSTDPLPKTRHRWPADTLESEQRPNQPQGFRLQISDLLLVTAFCAAAATLLRYAGMYGTLLIFIFAFGGTLKLRGISMQKRRKEFWEEFFWGVLIPITCFVTDPVLFSVIDLAQFGEQDKINFSNLPPSALATYAFVLWQILNLVASWFVAEVHSLLKIYFGGTLFAGALFAFGVGLLLLPATFVGMIIIVGVLGLTPFATSWVYFRSASRSWKPSSIIDSKPARFRALTFSGGFLLAVSFPIWIYFWISLSN